MVDDVADFAEDAPMLPPSASPTAVPVARVWRKYTGALCAVLLFWGIAEVVTLHISTRTENRSASFLTESANECIELSMGHLEGRYFNATQCMTRHHIQHTILNLVGTLSALFDEHNITYWLDSGTLLGAYREKSVIPYDVDADVGLTLDGYRTLRHGNFSVPDGYVLNVMGADHFEGGGRDPPLPARLISTTTGLYVDLFVFTDRPRPGNEKADQAMRDEFPFFDVKDWTNLNKEYDALAGFDSATVDRDDPDLQLFGPLPSVCFGGCKHCPRVKDRKRKWDRDFAIPHNWVFPLEDCAFGAFTVKCPRAREKYLKHLYGPKFMTPDKRTRRSLQS